MANITTDKSLLQKDAKLLEISKDLTLLYERMGELESIVHHILSQHSQEDLRNFGSECYERYKGLQEEFEMDLDNKISKEQILAPRTSDRNIFQNVCTMLQRMHLKYSRNEWDVILYLSQIFVEK